MFVLWKKRNTVITFAKDFATGFAFNMMVIHLWYLYMLLGLYLITPILYNLLKNSTFKKGMIIAISLCIFGSIVEMLKVASGTNIWVFWWLEFKGLFSIGYMLKEYSPKRKIYFLIEAIAIEIIATLISIALVVEGNKKGMIPVFIVTILMSWSTGIILLDVIINTILAYIISLVVIMGLSKIKILKPLIE